MILAYNESHRRHFSPGHVEQPRRVDAVINQVERSPAWRSLKRIRTEPARIEHLELVHTSGHIAHVADAVRRGSPRLDPDTYLTGESMAVALDAVGCVLGITAEVLEGRSRAGFAAVRPPGHHATSDRSMGFCLFSNVAIAARWAQETMGVGRVLIVDFDVHHGNGTQDIFYEDGSVMYMSTHQSPLYPGTGDLHERGNGDGEGTTVNVPLPSGTGDEAVGRVFGEIFRPIALEFSPELVLVSAGYDAHWKDPLGGMRLSTRGFAATMREIGDWAETCCDGRLVAALEGGYDVEALARSVVATLQVMIDPDAEIEDPIGPAPGTDMDLEEYLEEVKDVLR
ncbi:MAG: histone deacetylase [Rhodothermales bacterium]